MAEDTAGKREEALQFLIAHETGVLATAAPDGKPHARLVYYTADDSFNVYFITLAHTRKVGDIARNPHAAFVVSEPEPPRTLQIEGSVTDLTDTATLDPLLTDFVRRLMGHERFGIPLARFDSSQLKFFTLTPSWVRWGDFTFGQGTDTVLTKIDPTEK